MHYVVPYYRTCWGGEGRRTWQRREEFGIPPPLSRPLNGPRVSIFFPRIDS